MTLKAKHHCIALLGAALLAAQGAYAAVSLASLREMPGVSAAELVKRAARTPHDPVPMLMAVAQEPSVLLASLSPAAGRAQTTTPLRLTPSQAAKGLPLSQLLSAQALPAVTLVELSQKTHAVPGSQPMPETAVVATTRSQPSKANSKTVRVEIPAVSLEEEDVKATIVGDSRVAVTQDVVPHKLVEQNTELQANQNLELKITGSGGALKLYPPIMKFPKVGSLADVKVTATDVEALSLFVRDQDMVDWDSKKNLLKARLKGSTELYVVASGKMYIVPVLVEDATGPQQLQVPSALVSLDGVFDSTLQSALYPGLEQAVAAEVARVAVDEIKIETHSSGRVPASNTAAPSLNDSIAATVRTVQEAQNEATRYVAEDGPVSYKAITLQVIDERSAVAEGRIYPVAHVEVELLGTEFKAKTDATGHLTIRDMPMRSRFFVKINDPSGAIVPGVAELITDEGAGGGVVRIGAVRRFALEANTAIAGSVQNAALGTFCGTTVDKQGMPLPNTSAVLDVPAEGPFYFNAYGYLDRSLQASGPDGRFCFFNVLPGIAAVSLFESATLLTTTPIGVFAGRHTDGRFDLDDTRRLRTRLAAAPTAHHALGSDVSQAQAYATVDMIDLLPLGTDEPMMQLEEGLVSTQDPLLAHHGRLYAVSQAADFESVLYAFDPQSTAGEQVVPLLPRGFVEDMSIYAQVAHDPSQGVVLVEYANSPTSDNGALTIRLIDQDGQELGTGWYFADKPTTKALFFNVPNGVYTVQVETADQYWLGADTVIVYNETVSYVRLGGSLKYQP